MSHFVALAIPPSVPRREDSSVSAASKALDKSYATLFRETFNSIEKQSAADRTQRRFAELLHNHGAPDWDGDGADPTTLDAVSRTYDFVSNLPPRFSRPDVSVNRYGDVELEWYVRPDKLFTLAIGDGGHYHFASLNGAERRSGAGYLGGVPPELLLGIAGVLA